MNASKLKQVVDQAVELDREIAERTDQLKELKQLLVLEATGRPQLQITIPDGGKSIAFTGNDGCIARVTFPKPTLKATIDGEGKTIDKIREAAGTAFSRLFLQAPKYRLVEDFRSAATDLLDSRAARVLLKRCTVNSSARVSFETKGADDAC